MVDVIRERILKVKELAENGIEGEKKAAINLLKELLNKYDLSFDDLTENVIGRYEYSYTMSAEKILFFGIVRKVTDRGEIAYYKPPNQRIIILELTYVQSVEISALYSYYQKPFRKWLKEKIEIASHAFCRKNGLCRQTSTGTSEPITEEDLDMMRKIWREEEDIKALPKPNQKLISV